jgi:uncharacterized surface protein with fasciclin (FAS1) repeats
MIRTLTLTAAAAALIAAPTAATAQSNATPMSQKDLVTVASEAGSFKTLGTALQAAGLVETLQGAGPFTVFAPTDEAFAALPAGTLDALLKDKDKLRQVLLGHVVEGRVMASQVVDLKEAKTVSGLELPIRVKDGQVWIGDAKVVKTDVTASNGVIHVIDKVLLPPTM